LARETEVLGGKLPERNLAVVDFAHIANPYPGGVFIFFIQEHQTVLIFQFRPPFSLFLERSVDCFNKVTWRYVVSTKCPILQDFRFSYQ
jgi:hypothetical protein